MNQDTAHHMDTMLGDENSDDFVPLMNEAAYESAIRYDEVFPALPDKPEVKPEVEAHMANLGQWNQRMKMKSSVITQVFRVPMEERRFRELNQFGEQGDQAKICADIMRDTSANIEISSSKDQSLTIVVTGKEEAVLKARRDIIQKLQTQASVTIPIPKEHHRHILGKNGKRLKDLQLQTSTQITIPRPDDNLDEVKITGPKEGIDKARHEIQTISDEQAKLALERLNIPKIFHPFILGPNGQYSTDLSTQTHARINIPPPSVMKDEITVSGEKEPVAQAVKAIMAIYEEKKRKCQTVSVEVKKAQHKYIIGYKGQTIQEILATTGVSVEIPPFESTSETITLRGEQEKLGNALSKVYEMANSQKIEEVEVPSWLHKYIIGRQGSTIKQITQDLDKVHVKFTDGQDKIEVEGPKNQVDVACIRLQEQTNALLAKFSFDEIKVDSKYHKFIIGKNGANVNRLKQDLGVQIQIPADSDIIRVVGSPESVADAKKELQELVSKLENEVSKELKIEQRFHRTIIGTKGEKIKEIREKCNQVNITFPDHGVKSDRVTIRGPKEDVDFCYKELDKLRKELEVNSYKVEVPICKQHHKFVIGKGGANIRKIKDETDTKIELPAEGSESDVVIITGRRENVETAKEKIMEIQLSLENVVESEIAIPFKFHNSIIGTKGHLIRSIKDDCGGVTIHFPSEGSGSDKVSIRGTKEDVEKAKKQLLELSNEKKLADFTEKVYAKREHHKFLIGKNGVKIKKVRERTGARVIFPSDQSDDEQIVIMGHKEAVLLAKEELTQMIQDLDKLTEGRTQVEPRHHRHFVSRRGGVLQTISDEFGGVTITFPRNGENSDLVTLKGSKECVEGAIARILEIVQDLESRVTIDCIIPQKFHRTVMGAKGSRVQRISQEHNVQIKFPDREIRDVVQDDVENGEEAVPVTMNGDPEILEDDEPKKGDIITITGQSENCEAAKQALLSFVPITVEVNVAYDLHRYIIGQRGKGVRDMMEKYEVNIAVPSAASQSDVIKITGPPINVEDAKEGLLLRVQQLEDDRQDRALRNYRATVEVDPKYHPKIIGKAGANVNRIRREYKVQIQFPERSDSDDSIIAIVGYEKNAEDAKEEILKIVRELEDMHEVTVHIDASVHSRLIGTKGRNVRRIMDEYGVEIKFPRNKEKDDQDVVIVSGEEDRVEECVEYLKNLEEEYLQDIGENTRQAPGNWFQPEKGNDNRPPVKGFVVTGGPWEQRPPDTTSAEEFPSFGAAGEAPKSLPSWGPRH